MPASAPRARTCRPTANAEAFRPTRSSSTGRDKTAPRLGFAYDLKGDGKIEALRLVGHLLRHLQAEHAARLVRRRQVDVLLLHARHAGLTSRCGTRRARRPAPATFMHGASTSAQPSVKPAWTSRSPEDSKPMRTQELSFGFEHQLNNVELAASVRFVHKQLDRAIDDIGDLDPERERGLYHRQPRRRTGRRVRHLERPERLQAAGTGRRFPANAELITMPEGDAQLQQRRVRLDKRLSNQLDGDRSYTLEPRHGQLLGPVVVGRERPRQPEQLARLRLPVDVVRQTGQSARRRVRHRPHAPDQGARRSTCSSGARRSA